MDEFASACLRLALPILLAALGELVAERAGVINVGIEGMMLAGAFVAFCTAWLWESPLAAVAAASAAAAALALLFAVWTVILGADPIVTGMVLNLLALGGSGFAFRALVLPRGRPVTVVGFESWRLPAGLDPVPVLGLLATAGVYLLLRHTRAGLRLDAVGEAPHAAEARGVPVVRTRLLAALAGGCFAGVAGAVLVLGHAGTFVEGMTAGRGFIALALVLFGRWHPLGVAGATLFFGAALALQFDLQARGVNAPYQLVRALPYLLTLLVLSLAPAGVRRAPAALGRFFRRAGPRRRPSRSRLPRSRARRRWPGPGRQGWPRAPAPVATRRARRPPAVPRDRRV
jgi:simple sugar transport system permease protein